MKELIKTLKSLKNKVVLIAAHGDPDGDAIGATIAFGLLLRDLKAKPLLVNVHGTPDRYRFLETTLKVRPLEDLTEEEKAGPVCAFILDTAVPARIGFDLREEFPGIQELITIDHHISNSRFGDRNYVYPDKGATSEIIASLYLDTLGYIGKDAATAAYCGIMTDTGNLTYESTTSATVALVSILLASGAETGLFRRNVYENSTSSQMEGLRIILNNLRTDRHGEIAYSHLGVQDVKKLGLSPMDIENYVEYPRKIGTSEIALLFKEFEEGVVRVSVRTKGLVDGDKLARSFQGGGHKRAAGFRIRMEMSRAIGHVLQRINEGLDRNEWLD